VSRVKKSKTELRTKLSILVGCATFLISITTAALLYRGSNQYGVPGDGFSLTQNFFSDLGATQTYAGPPQLFSVQLFFGIALLAASAATILFFREQEKRVAPPSRLAYRLSSYATAVSIALVPFTPADLFGWPHRILVLSAVLFLAFAVGILTQRLPLRPWPHSLLRISSLTTYSYLLWIILGPLPDKGLGPHMVHSVAQKIVVYGFICVIMIYTLFEPKDSAAAS